MYLPLLDWLMNCPAVLESTNRSVSVLRSSLHLLF